MKRFAFSVVVFVLLTVSLTAQTTKFIAWDPNPATDNVAYYTMTFDGTAYSIPPDIDPSCGCIQKSIGITSGSHTVSVTATNAWGTGLPLTLTFNANSAAKVTNLRIR